MVFHPESDIPDLSGKVIIVTGGSSGLGKESVLQLAKHNPGRIFLGARTAARGNAAIAEVEKATPSMKGKITFLEMDLASFSSLQKAAKMFQAQADRLDILMNNAGVMAQPAGLTEDGYEIQFGSNYMGPALFTRLLLPTLQRTTEQPNSDVRVVNLSSYLFRQAPPEGLMLAKNKTTLSEIGSVARYGQSKLADAYHTKLIAREHPDILFVAVHPGVVNTGLFDDFKKRRPYVGALVALAGSVFLTDVHKGARAQLWASAAPRKSIQNGGFYDESQKEYVHKFLDNEALAKELEEWTNAEFEKKGL
jgi:NAD(P)-dependent dehydrogenase (short-subunit alcohol dehydrogenase family)